MFQGVQSLRASIPLSQNALRSAGEHPDIMRALSQVDKTGNPEVDRRFQNSMAGGTYGLPCAFVPRLGVQPLYVGMHRFVNRLVSAEIDLHV